MTLYSASVRDRAMNVQEGILWAVNKEITFWQAPHIAGVSPRRKRRRAPTNGFVGKSETIRQVSNQLTKS
jgi:hypothetical protein